MTHNDLLNEPVYHTTEHQPPELFTEFPNIIDNTARELYSTCPQKFWRSTIQKIFPRYTSIHLHFGAAFATGLETIRRAYYEDKFSQADALALGIEAALKSYGDYKAPVDSNKNEFTLVHGLMAYVTQYPLAYDYIKPHQFDNGKYGIEFTFAIPVPDVLHPVTEEPLFYAGRFDMFGVYQNSLFVVDDKSTSRLGPSWNRMWNLSSQLTGYCWAARQANIPVVGAIIRGQSFLKASFEFAEVIQYRPVWKLDEWYEILVDDLRKMKKDWKKNQFKKKLNSACTAYSGCPYEQLCSIREVVQKGVIDVHYQNKFWNPLHKNPEE